MFVFFVPDSFHSLCFYDSSMAACIYSLSLFIAEKYRYTTNGLSIHWFMNVWVINRSKRVANEAALSVHGQVFECIMFFFFFSWVNTQGENEKHMFNSSRNFNFSKFSEVFFFNHFTFLLAL